MRMRRKRKGTLKNRIIRLFLVFWIVMFVSTTTVSFVTISRLTRSSMTASVTNSLLQAQSALDSTLSNLNHVSQQLAYSSDMATLLRRYGEEARPYYRAALQKTISTRLNLIAFANPRIGLAVFAADGQDAPIYNNFALDAGFSTGDLPEICSERGIVYFGPHVSKSRTMKQQVLSARRVLNTAESGDISVYLESEFDFSTGAVDREPWAEQAFYLIENSDGQVIYSENEAVFPAAGRPGPGELSGVHGSYYWYRSKSGYGYSLVMLVPRMAFNSARNRWLTSILILSLLFLLAGIAIAYTLYRGFYRPLRLFSNVIDTMAEEPDSGGIPKAVQIPSTDIQEFDMLLERFSQMQVRIASLIFTIREKEKADYSLRYKLLMYQINPHFLTNTLNTVHWLAMSRKQADIDHIVQSLTRLLSYNLGKSSRQSTLGTELAMARQYLELQQYRYDFSYRILPPERQEALDAAVPKFILQPLAENAIFHGLDEDGLLTIGAEEEGGRVTIRVEDNGVGMEPEIQAGLNAPMNTVNPADLDGIGISYVKHALYGMFGEDAELTVQSAPRRGTQVRIRIPCRPAEKEEDACDPGIGGG